MNQAPFIVVCKDDAGAYVLATRTAWASRADAQRYAGAIAPDRAAIVVECPRGLNFVHLPAIGDGRGGPRIPAITEESKPDLRRVAESARTLSTSVANPRVAIDTYWNFGTSRAGRGESRRKRKSGRVRPQNSGDVICFRAFIAFLKVGS